MVKKLKYFKTCAVVFSDDELGKLNTICAAYKYRSVSELCRELLLVSPKMYEMYDKSLKYINGVKQYEK